MCQLKKVILVLHVQLVLLVCVLSVSDVEPEVGNLFDSSSDNEQPDTEGGHAPSGTEEEEDFGLRRVFEEQLSLEEQRTERAKVKMDQRRRVIRAFVDDVNRLLTEPPIDNRRTKRTVDCLARQLQTLRAREQATLLEQLARLQSRPASERTHVYKALLLGGEGTEEEPLLVVGPGHPSETSTSSASPNKSEQTANAKDVDALLIRLLVLNEFTSDHKLIDETDEDLPIWIDTLSRMKKGKTRAALYRELTRLKRVGPVLMHNYMAFIDFRTEIGTEAAQTGPIVINAQRLMELVTKVPILQSRKAKTTNEYDIELPFIVLRVLSQSVSDNVTDNTTRMINALRQFQDGENDAEEEENKQLLWYFFSNVAEDTHRELLSTGSSVAVNLDSLLHSLGNLRQCVRRLDGIKYTVVHELLEDIMRETRETCQMFVDLIRETRPRPSMLNRFYVNILYGVQNRVETSPLLYEWLLVLRELNKELGTVFFNEDGSVVVADVVEKSKQEKKKEEERDEVEAEQRGKEMMHITAALSSGSGNLDSGLEPFLDNTVDPREEALIYCWLFPTGEYRRRFYALIHRFGLSAEQVCYKLCIYCTRHKLYTSRCYSCKRC
jgi:hypothetical protein